MMSVHIDTTRAGHRALVPVPGAEWCRNVRWLLVLALALGVLAMHAAPGASTTHTTTPAVAHAAPAHHAHGSNPGSDHSTGPDILLASDKRFAGWGPDECTQGSGDAPVHAAHCIPAPGGVPPAPPAVVVLERSDALPQPPAASVPRSILPRAPAPDLTQLSISRT
ncbi:DUF6153 family protein [Sinomonas flava]